MQYIIGVDIGTTHTKAVLVNTEGKVLEEIKAGYPTFQPLPGYSEQNPEAILNAVMEVLQKAVAAVAGKEKILCVCLSAAMHSIMAVNTKGGPLTPLLTWADTRSNHYAGILEQTARGKRLYEQTGTPIHPMSPLCKIAWIKDEMPDVFAAAYKFISIKEYVLYCFSGEFIVDYSIASATGLFDTKQLAWNNEAMEFAGITAEQLSRPVPPTYVCKGYREEYAKRAGLSKDILIVTGAGDGCLANLGSGAVLDDEAAVTIGTSGAVRKFSKQSTTVTRQQLFNYLVDDKTYLCGGGINNGGIVLKWFATTFLNTNFSSKEDFDSYMQLASSIPAGSDGLLFLPYVYGERAPVWDAGAKGVFFGISSQHTKAHFMRSVLEAVCFSLLQVLKVMEETGGPVDTVYASGGFIESSLWLQILTDVFNKKIKVSYAADASAIGAAFMGMHAMGLVKEWKEVKPFIETGTTFYPDPIAHKRYMKNFSVYEHLYDKLKADFRNISAP
jgi:gluconokinase